MNPGKKTRIVFYGLIACCIFCSILFSLIHSKGADDVNMLSTVLLDEAAIYPIVEGMVTDPSGQGLWESFISPVYYYGYPFFFFSGLAVSPIQILNKIVPLNVVKWSVLFLRQMDLWFILLSILLGVYLATEYATISSSFLLFATLVCMPGIVRYGTFFHPDGLNTLCLVLAVFFLIKDNLKTERFYWLSLLFCALSISTKKVGIFMAPTYLGYYLMSCRRRDWRFLIKSIGFVVLTFFLTTPYLFMPKYFYLYFNNYVKSQLELFVFSESKVDLPSNLLSLWYFSGSSLKIFSDEETFKDFWNLSMGLKLYFGSVWFYLFHLIVGFIGFFQKKTRLYSYVVLSFVVPYTLYFLFRVRYTWAYWYFLPSVILLICLSFHILDSRLKIGKFVIKRNWGIALFCCVLVIPFVNFVQVDTFIFKKYLNLERENQSIHFYKMFAKNFLNSYREGKQSIKILKDIYIYLPREDQFKVSSKYGFLNYSDIQNNQPDLVILTQNYIEICKSISSCDSTAGAQQDPEKAVELYGGAFEGLVRGYKKVYSDSFGVVFVKEKS